MNDRVRITVDGELLHEGPRSWSSDGQAQPTPEPTEYDLLPPYGLIVNFAGFPLSWTAVADKLAPLEFEMTVYSVGLRFKRNPV